MCVYCLWQWTNETIISKVVNNIFLLFQVHLKNGKNVAFVGLSGSNGDFIQRNFHVSIYNQSVKCKPIRGVMLFISLATRKLICFRHKIRTHGKSSSTTRRRDNMLRTLATVNPQLASTQIKAKLPNVSLLVEQQ